MKEKYKISPNPENYKIRKKGMADAKYGKASKSTMTSERRLSNGLLGIPPYGRTGGVEMLVSKENLEMAASKFIIINSKVCDLINQIKEWDFPISHGCYQMNAWAFLCLLRKMLKTGLLGAIIGVGSSL